MSKLQLRTPVIPADRQTFERIDKLIDKLGNDDLADQISDDIVKFIDKMGNMHKRSLKGYVVVYLDHLAKKYGVPITKS